MQDHRQVELARQLELGNVVALLDLPVQAGHEVIEADLAHRHQARVVPMATQRLAQGCQFFVGDPIDTQGMDAQRISEAMTVRECANGIEVAGVDGRQHHLRHADRARAPDHLVPVAVELGRIEVAVGVDPVGHALNHARTRGTSRARSAAP